jgi:hypothetical protein
MELVSVSTTGLMALGIAALMLGGLVVMFMNPYILSVLTSKSDERYAARHRHGEVKAEAVSQDNIEQSEAVSGS